MATKQRFKQAICLAGVTLLLCGVTAYGQSAVQTWTDLNGRSLQARFVSLVDSTLTLQRVDGRKLKLPIHRLDDASIKQAQALAAPDDPDAAPPVAEKAAAMHGTSGKEVATLKAGDTTLTLEKDGDGFIACTGGETFPLETFARVYVVGDNGKDRLYGKPHQAPKVAEREAVLFLEFGEGIHMEVHYELDLQGNCAIWYRYKNTTDQQAEPQLGIKFPQLVGIDAGTGGFFKNRTNETLTKSQLRSWLGRKDVKLDGFEGSGNDDMPYTELNPRSTGGSFKTLTVDAGVYHNKSIEVDAPKARKTTMRFFLDENLAPYNGFGIRLEHQLSWERTDRSSAMTLTFK